MSGVMRTVVGAVLVLAMALPAVAVAVPTPGPAPAVPVALERAAGVMRTAHTARVRQATRRTHHRTTYRAARRLPPPPRVRAAGWSVADLDTGAELATYRPRATRQPASTLKLLTALTVVATVPRRPPHRVTRRQARATCVCVGLRPGRSYTRGSLLDALLMPSANDAAQALAGAHPRGKDAFLRAMKRQGRALGLRDTTAANPHGLTHRGNATSPRDLLALLRAAQSTPGVEKHLARRSTRFGPVGGPEKVITRSNAYVETYPAAQGKTGYTTAAGYNLVVATPMRVGARRQGRVHRIGAATMGSPSREASVRATRALTVWVARHRGALRSVGRLPAAPGPVVGQHERWVR